MKKGKLYTDGLKAGIPIALGYFAVGLTIGIAAKNASLTAFQATLMSFLLNASAGEYIGMTLIAAHASYFEMILMEAVANARYLLMSCALSQKLRDGTGTLKRMLLGFDNTDEIFGVSIGVEGKLDPVFSFGAMSVAIPGWSLGTLTGYLLGNVLPQRVISAIGVSLFGMFISVFVPESKKNKVVFGLVLAGFALSFAFTAIPLFDGISDGIKILIMTVGISLFAAIVFPVDDGSKDGKTEGNDPETQIEDGSTEEGSAL